MSSRVQVVRPDCLVSDAAGLMGKAGISCLVVVDGRKPLGILTEKDLLGLLDRHKNQAFTVAEIMSPSVITAAADTDFRSAYALLRRHGIRHLVVADGSGKLLGVATATDFRTHLSQEVFSKIDHLHAVLDPVVSQLTGDASLGQAVKHMVDANWDYVLVVEQGIPLGIITERDIPRLWSTDRDPEEVPLREIMTCPLHCIPVSTQVAEASASMARLRVRHLPVVDESGQLLGVVSQNRMLEKLGLALFDEVWRDHVSLQAQKSELETRLGLILEATGLGVWDYDHHTDGLVWSPKFALACGKPEGWSPAGLQAWMDLIHPRDRSAVLEGFQSTLAPDNPLYQGEFRMQGADGNWRWIHVRGRVLQRDEQGRPLRTAGSMVDISETKRVRRSLEDERLRLRSLLNTIPDLVWLKDPDGVYLFCNPSYERLLAASEADIIGKTDYHFVSKDLGDFFRERDRAAVEAGTSVMNEEWLISATDGYSGLYETLKTPLLTEEGSLVGVLGIARDITERRQAEAALQASVQEYQDLVEQIPIGVYKLRMLRDGGRVLDFVSPRWCEILGVDGPEVLADERIAFGRIHPADRESFLRANGAAKQALSKFVWEGRILKDGEVRWLHIESRPSVLKNGDILWNGIQYDVTDRRNAEETLRRAAGVFHSTQEGIVITDIDNLIVDVNPAFTQITGFSREEVLGQNPKMLSSGIHGADFYERMWKTVMETGNWRGEVCNRRKSGELYTEMLSIAMARDQQGQIKEFIGVFSDISRLKEHAAELDRIAHYDTLTSLPNRRLLADRLGQAIARARRSGKLLAVCYLDLDGFKPVNDRFGHDAGDQLLVSLTRHLQEVLREEDTLARLGGDEFVLLLNDLLRDQECGQLLDRVLAAVSRPLYLANNLIKLSASIGVTLYPHDNADGDTLLRHADQAMYRAKESGRNRYHLFDPEYDRQVREQRHFLQQVSQGLSDGEFVLYYQPKVNLIHGDVVGVEALVRWRHPKDGLLEPRGFLPMLSGTEVDGQLGQWVIDAALSQLARWNSEGLDLGVSVNISAEHLLSPDFAQGLQAALRRYPAVGEGGLELEILESVAISDLEQASLALQAGLSLGVRFALDDFGTGYSSLTYFRRLPVDTLKVDGSFVRDMLDDPDDLGIVESVVRLAEAFNRQAIAEGVETLQHASLLVKLGCKLGQGYGIAPPMPAEALGGWMKSWHAAQAWRQLGSSRLPSEDTALLLAIVSHRQWGERVSNYTQAPNGRVPTMDSHACRLGQWYYRGGMRRYGQLPKFRELEGVHERFHALGNELSVLAGKGQSTLAQSRLPEFFALRDVLLRTVEQLIDHAQAD